MTFRIANFANPGELFKRPREVKAFKGLKQPRQLAPKHLEAIRKLPCIACGEEPCGEAAHVRQASAAHNKRSTGMSEKPDDKWTIPLCHEHHMLQHSHGELKFFHNIGVSPFLICERLWAVSGDIDAMRRIIMKARR